MGQHFRVPYFGSGGAGGGAFVAVALLEGAGAAVIGAFVVAVLGASAPPPPPECVHAQRIAAPARAAIVLVCIGPIPTRPPRGAIEVPIATCLWHKELGRSGTDAVVGFRKIDGGERALRAHVALWLANDRAGK